VTAGERPRCKALTARGERCRNPAGADGLCTLHRRRLEAAATQAGEGPEAGADLGALAPFLSWA
jgi:hypothetical protein